MTAFISHHLETTCGSLWRKLHHFPESRTSTCFHYNTFQSPTSRKEGLDLNPKQPHRTAPQPRHIDKMGRFDSLKANNPFRHHGGSSSGSGSGAANVDDVAPPPGPPPSYNATTTKPNDDFAPPPGPPPSHHQPQHDWQSVPLPDDTSSYPPPPDIFTGHDRSWANNATEAQAEEGERWCARYPLLRPLVSAPPSQQQHPPRLLAPNANTFAGTIATPARGQQGTFLVRTTPRSGDACATVQPPCYLAARDDPRRGGSSGGGGKTVVYFEVRILAAMGGDDGSVAIGFTALPYPPFRMPGWHRGSLAVHSDDGRRYVNDRWGGVDFVAPWGGARGTVVGVGLRFSCSSSVKGGIDVECFFTRDGRLEGSWDVNGERDAQRDLEPIGVQGFHDLVAVVGTFQRTEVEVVLDPGRWVYRGVGS